MKMIYTAQEYDDDGLLWTQNNKFIENVLRGYSEATEKAMGLSDPQPDWTFGIKQGPYPDPNSSLLGVPFRVKEWSNTRARETVS